MCVCEHKKKPVMNSKLASSKISSLQFFQLDKDTFFEHIFERYVRLEDNINNLKQDLGIQNRDYNKIEIDIEPSDDQQQYIASIKNNASKQQNKEISRRRKRGGGRTRRGRKTEQASAINLDIEEGVDTIPVSIIRNTFNFIIDQSLTSLNSSKDNNNSTTGYVLWSITPFFIKWLLYEPTAEPFRSGISNYPLKGESLGEKEMDTLTIMDNPCIQIPSILNLCSVHNKEIDRNSTDDCNKCVIELGSGISGILPIVLGNYVDYYVGTDQRGILPKLKYNIKENCSQVTLRDIYSKSLNLKPCDDSISVLEENSRYNEKREIKKPRLNLEIECIDWETFKLDNKTISNVYPSLATIKQIEKKTVYIIAMDVIYNDFLIKPFLNTIKQLRDYYLEGDKNGLTNVVILIGVHLRSQEVVTTFLEHAIEKKTWTVYSIDILEWKTSRFNLYMIK